MELTHKTDPARNYRFKVEILPGFHFAAFRKVSGLAMTTEVVTWREGGDPAKPKKLPGTTDCDPITLDRGVCTDLDMWRWMEQVFQLSEGTGSPEYRKDMRIAVLDNKQVNPTELHVWNVYGAWPSKYSVADLDAGANEVLIETMEIQNAGWERIK